MSSNNNDSVKSPSPLSFLGRHLFTAAWSLLGLVILPSSRGGSDGGGDSASFASALAFGLHHKSTQAVAVPPPTSRRDEERVLFAGVAPPGWDTDVPRQAETSTERMLDPPVAISDPYGWLRRREGDDGDDASPEVLDYLQKENNHTQSLTRHLEPLRSQIYTELLSAIQETDYTLPRPHGDYYYYSRTFEGKSYDVHCRAPIASQTFDKDKLVTITWDGSATSTILQDEHPYLDINALATNQEYCMMGSVESSPSQTLLAYAVDFTGDEMYELHVLNIDTGATIYHHDPELEICEEVLWGQDDETLFYLQMDDEQRPYRLYRKRLKVSSSGDDHENKEQDDQLLFEESDVLFWIGMYKSLDGRYLFLDSASAETSEVWYLDLHEKAPNSTLQCIAKRRHKVLYEVTHRLGHWWIMSNVGGTPNMKLLTAQATPNCEDEWRYVRDPHAPAGTTQPLFDGSHDKALEDITTFSNHVVIEGRQGGIPRIWILAVEDDDDDGSPILTSATRLEFPEAAHDVGLGGHYEFGIDKIVVGYESLVTPSQGLEIRLDDPSNMDMSKRIVLKEQNVPGYEKELYGCDRVTVTSRDGTTEIPVSLVYRKDVMERAKRNDKGEEPVRAHLYAYGAYGESEEDSFSSTILPLLNRGIIYVIAHVRGGGEMGRQWYEEPNGGKYLCKKNTFNDFVDVAKWLVEDRKWTTPDYLSCEGRSAGGMTIAASMNQEPELFKAAILGVPFVDLVATMSDASIPLTAGEWEEWGNPNEVKYFDYMMSYCPMRNVKDNAKYPSCLLLGGLHDPRVAYWEPAKLAATLRHHQGPDSGPVCLKIEMSAGHFSASDRYKYLKETAFDFAFLLDQVGLATSSCAKGGAE